MRKLSSDHAIFCSVPSRPWNSNAPHLALCIELWKIAERHRLLPTVAPLSCCSFARPWKPQIEERTTRHRFSLASDSNVLLHHGRGSVGCYITRLMHARCVSQRFNIACLRIACHCPLPAREGRTVFCRYGVMVGRTLAEAA